MRSSCVAFLLHSIAAFQLAPLRALPRVRSFTVVDMAGPGADETPQPADEVQVTIRKRSSSEGFPAFQEGSAVFVAKFSHVKKSLSTLLKFWLMGGCGELDTEGWSGIGELDAQHSPSGTRASIQIDVEHATVSLVSQSSPSVDGNMQLNRYAAALLDELESLAKTEEAAAADRLCYPPEAVDTARLAAWASLAPRDSADVVSGQQDGGSETEFQKFLRSLK
jgi:hypothetical protein